MIDFMAPELRARMDPTELRVVMVRLERRSAAALGSLIGVSPSTVSTWLCGKVGVPRPAAILLRLLVSQAN